MPCGACKTGADKLSQWNLKAVAIGGLRRIRFSRMGQELDGNRWNRKRENENYWHLCIENYFGKPICGGVKLGGTLRKMWVSTSLQVFFVFAIYFLRIIFECMNW